MKCVLPSAGRKGPGYCSRSTQQYRPRLWRQKQVSAPLLTYKRTKRNAGNRRHRQPRKHDGDRGCPAVLRHHACGNDRADRHKYAMRKGRKHTCRKQDTNRRCARRQAVTNYKMIIIQSEKVFLDILDVSDVRIGAPKVTPSAYIETVNPAVVTDIFISSAINGALH